MEKFDGNNSLKGRIIFIDQIDMKIYYPDLHFIGFAPDGLGYAIFAFNKKDYLEYKCIRPLLVYDETRTKCQCIKLWTGEYNWDIIKNKKLDIKKTIIDGDDYNKNYFKGMCFLISEKYLNNLPIHNSFMDLTNFFQIDKEYLYNFVNNHPKCISVSNSLNEIDFLKFLLKTYDVSKKNFKSITLQTIDINKLNENIAINFENDKPSINIQLGMLDFITFERVDDVILRKEKDKKLISFTNKRENYFSFIVNNWYTNFKKYNNWQNNIKHNVWLSIYNIVDNKYNISSHNMTNKKELEFVNGWLNDNTKEFDPKNKLFKIYHDYNSNKKDSNKNLYMAFKKQVDAYNDNRLIGLDGKPLKRKEEKKIWVPSR